MYNIVILKDGQPEDRFIADTYCLGCIVEQGKPEESIQVRVGGDKKGIVFAHQILGQFIVGQILPGKLMQPGQIIVASPPPPAEISRRPWWKIW